MAEAAITFDNLTLGYGSHAAVHHLSGAIEKGTLLAVVGANDLQRLLVRARNTTARPCGTLEPLPSPG
jgi:ATPase subunit of ABC transporter with duplicated ATPase domains